MLRSTRHVLAAALLMATAIGVQAAPAAQAGAAAGGRLAHELAGAAPDLGRNVIDLAVQAMSCATAAGMPASRRLAVIDYSRPSLEPRLWVFDLDRRKLLFHELVAHGRNSGDNLTTHFSNENGSLASSLGLFRTDDTYEGGNGYSLRLDGLEPGFNDRARERAIVMHGAPYVNAEIGRGQGRLGRSLGCPAVRSGIARQVIDSLKHGQFVFSYYPDQQWLGASPMLNCPRQLAARQN